MSDYPPIEYDNIIFVDHMACDLMATNYSHGLMILSINESVRDSGMLMFIRVRSIGDMIESNHYITLSSNGKIRFSGYESFSSSSPIHSSKKDFDRAAKINASIKVFINAKYKYEIESMIHSALPKLINKD